jgi:multimeric flavodoxin WrbA
LSVAADDEGKPNDDIQTVLTAFQKLGPKPIETLHPVLARTHPPRRMRCESSLRAERQMNALKSVTRCGAVASATDCGVVRFLLLLSTSSAANRRDRKDVMRALVLSCTLKPSPEPSNTEALARVLTSELDKHGVTSELIRLVDLNIKPGVKTDQGPGDDWPTIHKKILASDILIIATPTWLGQASSVTARALERMDAMLSETTSAGLPVAYGKVGGVVITGNEDGAHHIVGTVCQALIDIGFTVPGASWTYWHLGPGPGPNYLDTDAAHDYSDRTGRNAARNLLTVAKALADVEFSKPEMSQ